MGVIGKRGCSAMRAFETVSSPFHLPSYTMLLAPPMLVTIMHTN